MYKWGEISVEAANPIHLLISNFSLKHASVLTKTSENGILSLENTFVQAPLLNKFISSSHKNINLKMKNNERLLILKHFTLESLCDFLKSGFTPIIAVRPS